MADVPEVPKKQPYLKIQFSLISNVKTASLEAETN